MSAKVGSTLYTIDRFKTHTGMLNRQDYIRQYFNNAGHSDTYDQSGNSLDFRYVPGKVEFAMDMDLLVSYSVGINTMEQAPTAQNCRTVKGCTGCSDITQLKPTGPTQPPVGKDDFSKSFM